MTTKTAFSLPIRVYYEDTDAGGIMYHASYLRFAERARTEWLRALGINQDELKSTLGLGFVVTRITVDYLRPARLDDLLDVKTSVTDLGRATLKLRQEVRRDDTILSTLDVTVACVELHAKSGTGRVARLPEALYKQLAG